jgi:hypothetical protein
VWPAAARENAGKSISCLIFNTASSHPVTVSVLARNACHFGGLLLVYAAAYTPQVWPMFGNFRGPHPNQEPAHNRN